jgi:hypothetical protein
MKQWIVGVVVLTVALLVPAVARPHGGHAHKVMGTVSSIEGDHVMVKSRDGKSVMVMLDSKTKVTQGKTPLDAAALKVGDRIVAEGPEENEMIMATSVRIGRAPAPAKATGTAGRKK